jgi:hypothetical protein
LNELYCIAVLGVGVVVSTFLDIVVAKSSDPSLADKLLGKAGSSNDPTQALGLVMGTNVLSPLNIYQFEVASFFGVCFRL